MQVRPAHGAGSACGKALGAIPSSTVGHKRLYSWWGPYLAVNDEQGFIDTRPNSEVQEGTVIRSTNVPAGTFVPSYGAWVVNPVTDKNPPVLLVQNQGPAQNMWDHLVRVGIDRVCGYVTRLEGLPIFTPKLIQPEELDGSYAAWTMWQQARQDTAEQN